MASKPNAETGDVVWDYVLVGVGSAGCVLANRLSESGRNRVLVLEAGRDTPPGEEPADILSPYPLSYYNQANMWPGLSASWSRSHGQRRARFPQARVMGGGSSVMGMVALRGLPEDYDAWAKAGASGWSHDDVLPFFKKLEHDFDHAGELHGRDGPVPIRRVAWEDWPPLARAVGRFAAQRGFPEIDDMNADFRDGYGRLPMSNWPDTRASAAICYLGPDVRARPNLTIRTECEVRRLLFEGTRVTGVSADIDGAETIIRGREVIVCTGAIHTPALLMRSGVGPARELAEHGHAVVTDLPGVGSNLQNHAIVFFGMHMRRHGRQQRSLVTHPVTCFRLSSGQPGAPDADLYINIQSKTSWNALGRQIANLAPVLWQPASRGRVSLGAGHADPDVAFNFMAAEEDVERLSVALALTLEILAAPEVRGLCRRPFAIRFNDLIRRLNQFTSGNAVRARAIAMLFDLVPPAAGVALERLTGSGADLDELRRNEQARRDHIRANVGGMFHPVGTCRMGAADDPEAVVDTVGRVHGLSGLRVVDASIMPKIPRGNTNIPTIMLAEKMARDMLAEAS